MNIRYYVKYMTVNLTNNLYQYNLHLVTVWKNFCCRFRLFLFMEFNKINIIQEPIWIKKIIVVQQVKFFKLHQMQ